eukprot:2857767-Rhodomonas_salina.1
MAARKGDATTTKALLANKANVDDQQYQTQMFRRARAQTTTTQPQRNRTLKNACVHARTCTCMANDTGVCGENTCVGMAIQNACALLTTRVCSAAKGRHYLADVRCFVGSRGGYPLLSPPHSPPLSSLLSPLSSLSSLLAPLSFLLAPSSRPEH